MLHFRSGVRNTLLCIGCSLLWQSPGIADSGAIAPVNATPSVNSSTLDPLSATVTSTVSHGEVSPAEIVAILRNAKIVTPDYPLRASLNGHEAVITTQRNPAASDKDCKIDAVMFAKTLMDSIPELLRIKVLFSDYEKQRYTQVGLSRGDITAYGDGKLKRDDFLNSLEITSFTENVSPFAPRGGESSATGVVAGPMQDKRLLLLSRIEALKQKGTNVKAYTDYFLTIEAAAKAGDETTVASSVAKLSANLNDQEKMRQQAAATGLQMEVLRFQKHLQQYITSGHKLTFDMSQVMKVQQLVVAGRNVEAKALMQSLEMQMR